MKLTTSKKNRILGLFERNLLDKEGLPKRKWFKHILQAPGLYLGYEPEVFPGIQQAFSEKNNTMLQQEITRAVSAINRGIRMLTPQNSGEPFVQAVY
mmetsp:Transcript_32769/g.40251  ORF Transcript_32769/g.40251 Transcript_32769/m.40251 type:complete len:97 (+) Transcript_32769:1806-2096(+)